MTRKALKLSVAGEVEEIDLDAGDSLKIMQDAVGGLIEPVNLGQYYELYVNEEGLLIGLEPNAIASAMASAVYNDAVFLMGDVLITGTVDDEGETLGLEDWQIVQLRKAVDLLAG